MTPRGVRERGNTIWSSPSSSNSLIASCTAKEALFNVAGSIFLAKVYSTVAATETAFDEIDAAELSSVASLVLVLDPTILPASC
jgi:hypothetical protein